MTTESPKSWKPAVVADSSGKWAYNGLRFKTRQEAYESAAELAGRWFLVTKYDAHASDDEPTHAWLLGQLWELDKVPAVS